MEPASVQRNVGISAVAQRTRRLYGNSKWFVGALFLANANFTDGRVDKYVEIAVFNDKELYEDIKKKYASKRVQGQLIIISHHTNTDKLNNPHLSS